MNEIQTFTQLLQMIVGKLERREQALGLSKPLVYSWKQWWCGYLTTDTQQSGKKEKTDNGRAGEKELRVFF